MINFSNIVIFSSIYKTAAIQGIDSVENMLWGNELPEKVNTISGGGNVLRDRVIQIAQSQLGQGDWRKYLQGTVSSMPNEKKHWCGLFALWVLQIAGITSKQWTWGSGISSILPPTKNPKPGDIAYFTHNNHHAIIEKIDGDNMITIDGNSWGGKVVRNDRKLSDAYGFYSIGPLIGEVNT